MAISKFSRGVDRVFRAISHPGRRHLLHELKDQPGLTLSELSGRLPMTRQAVSQHLELLETAELVVTRWRGRAKLHYLNPGPLCEAHDLWLAPLLTAEALALTEVRDRSVQLGI